MALALDPRIQRVWRSPHALQFGVDAPVLVLDPVGSVEERMLAALASGVSRGVLEVVAQTAGGAPGGWRRRPGSRPAGAAAGKTARRSLARPRHARCRARRGHRGRARNADRHARSPRGRRGRPRGDRGGLRHRPTAVSALAAAGLILGALDGACPKRHGQHYDRASAHWAEVERPPHPECGCVRPDAARPVRPW